MDTAPVDDPGESRPGGTRAEYRRSTGSPRGTARRRQLLACVADDLAAHGLVDFSLRRAARAAGTTHKVLLYHFASAEDLLAEAVVELRSRRIAKGLAIAAADEGGRPLAERVEALWAVLTGEEGRVLDQAIGLVLYDPQRYARLGREASQHYLPALLQILPATWSEQRRVEVAEMVLATLRGFLIGQVTSASPAEITAGFRALGRALAREEQDAG